MAADGQFAKTHPCGLSLRQRNSRRRSEPRERPCREPFGAAPDKRYAFKMERAPGDLPSGEEAELLRSDNSLSGVPKIGLCRVGRSNWIFERGWRIKGELPLSSAPAAALVEAGTALRGSFSSTAGRRLLR